MEMSQSFSWPKNRSGSQNESGPPRFLRHSHINTHSSFTPFIHPLPLEDSNNGPLLSKSCCHHWHLKDQLSHKRQQSWWSREIVHNVHNGLLIHVQCIYSTSTCSNVLYIICCILMYIIIHKETSEIRTLTSDKSLYWHFFQSPGTSLFVPSGVWRANLCRSTVAIFKDFRQSIVDWSTHLVIQGCLECDNTSCLSRQGHVQMGSFWVFR